MTATRATIYLIGDDDRDHVTFVTEQLSTSPLNLCVHVSTPAEAMMYLESLALHNPTGRPLPCVLLLAFSDDSSKREVLEWLRARPLASPLRIVALRSLYEPPREHYMMFGADEVIPRYPRAGDLAAACMASTDPMASG